MIPIYEYISGYLTEQFESVSVLREKATGRVELIRHKNTGKLFILRRIKGSDEVYERLRSIQCPSLSGIYESACSASETVVIEEFIEGDTLAYVLKGGLLSYRKAAVIVSQVCDALWALHSVGAVHRDVKPENIIIQGDRAILIDFDASRLVKETQSLDTKVIGTVGYAAPEQFGIKQTDHRADIYSLGVVLNIMLTGMHPAYSLATGKAGRIVKKCTHISPEKRYKDAAELKAAL